MMTAPTMRISRADHGASNAYDGALIVGAAECSTNIVLYYPLGFLKFFPAHARIYIVPASTRLRGWFEVGLPSRSIAPFCRRGIWSGLIKGLGCLDVLTLWSGTRIEWADDQII